MTYTRFRNRANTGPLYGSSYVIGKYYTYNNHAQFGAPVDQNLPGNTPSSIEIEKCWDSVNPGPPYRTGSAFAKLKVVSESLAIKARGKYHSKNAPGFPAGFWTEYIGGFTNPVFAGDTLSHNNYVSLGTAPNDTNAFPLISPYLSDAWKRTAPQIRKANLAQFLFEFREVPRMLKQTAKLFRDAYRPFETLKRGKKDPLRMSKEASGQFLGFQFGWLPFVRDLQDLNKVWHNSEKYIAQITRDNDRWIRRSRIITTTEESTRINRQLNVSGCWPSANFRILDLCQEMTLDGGAKAKVFSEVWKDEILKVWAEGSFRYYRPMFDDRLKYYPSTWQHINRLLAVYGAEINPAVVYKVTPWTWLIDWFTNVGDVIDADVRIAEDGVVSNYLYCMHRRVVEIVQKSYFNFYSGPICVEWRRKIDSKQRASASSPYGFGLTWEQLSPKQLTILSALGIAKV
jgi:hypothetical protein